MKTPTRKKVRLLSMMPEIPSKVTMLVVQAVVPVGPARGTDVAGLTLPVIDGNVST
jgi:hypothetical protein